MTIELADTSDLDGATVFLFTLACCALILALNIPVNFSKWTAAFFFPRTKIPLRPMRTKVGIPMTLVDGEFSDED
jgi:hypothetical protein